MWWSDWMDNIVWKIALENKIEYELFLEQNDYKNWRNYRNEKEKQLFKELIINCKRKINIINWYLKRNRKMIKNVKWLIMFLDENKKFNSWTLYTYKFFFKLNNWKNILNKKINKYNFLRFIKLI